jgi:hypothetical protein
MSFPHRARRAAQTQGSPLRIAARAERDARPSLHGVRETAAAAQATSICSKSFGPLANETFVNNASESVNVYWVDYGCVEQLYFTLAPGGSQIQTTYTGHVWRMRAVNGGTLLAENVAVPHQVIWAQGNGACSTGAVPATWTFANATSTSRDVFWLDGGCKEIYYATLLPGGNTSQNTFVGHRWRFKVAGKRRVVGEAEVTRVGAATTTIRALGTKPLPRTTADRADDSQLPQVKVLYAVPLNGTDNRFDSSGRLALSVAAGQQWLNEQSGGRRLRFDSSGGKVDVTFVKLPRTEAQYATYGVFARDEIEDDLVTKGFNKANKTYLVFYEGTSTSCGTSYRPPSLDGVASLIFLKTCAQQVTGDAGLIGLTELSWLHEVFHALGAVPASAPHHTLAGHASDDPADLMYAGPESWRPALQDSGRDDYWTTGNPTCLDVAKSVFLK